MKSKKKLFSLVVSIIIMGTFTFNYAEEKKEEKTPPYVFEDIVRLPATNVKSQGSTGTCWDFGTMSFLESEVLRKGLSECDLSEMFVVRHAYEKKALNYVQMHGLANFSQGGQAHDVIDQLREHGIVPESVYPGIVPGEKKHNHGELATVLRNFLDGVVKRRSRRITRAWMPAFSSLLDIYLGKSPKKFTYQGKEYTPSEFMKKKLKINPDDYIEVTSYSHHPFYRKVRLELPDNWTYNRDYYNVPMNDLKEIADSALKNGYTFVWDADVSEHYFSKDRMDICLVPVADWDDLSRKERSAKITEPVKEKEITQKMRQETFENWSTTDDHLMHIIGIARDQQGHRYYIMKNSWDVKDRAYKGYFYVSEAYFKLKTINIMIHRDAVPKKIMKKFRK